MLRYSRIPAGVSISTKYGGQFTLMGWYWFSVNPSSAWWGHVMEYYAQNCAYVASLVWSAWSGYSDVQCGRVYQVRTCGLSYLWNGNPSSVWGFSEATDYDVRFQIQWPEVPAGAENVNYVIKQETLSGGDYQAYHTSSTDPVATFSPTVSLGNGEQAPLDPNPNGVGETNWISGTKDYSQVCCSAYIEYWDYDGTDCDELGVNDDDTLTDETATLHSPVDDMSWTYGTEDDETGTVSEDGVLTGLTADTWYWFQQPGVCSKKFWFKTKKKDDDETWAASIITLPATEVWATGATMHGMFWYKGNSRFYVALGFEYGRVSLTGNSIIWLYTQGAAAHNTDREFKMPIQMTIAGLLPDTTYNYRACLHLHNPNGTLIPMNTNNYFGETMSFGGPVSQFGFGREYITAKKAEDDVSRLAVGRYYMDKQGMLQYESNQRRKTA